MEVIVNSVMPLKMVRFDSVKDIIESTEEIRVFNTVAFNSTTKYTIEFVNGDKMKRDILDRYLNGVINELGQSLLYRGIYPGE